MKSICSRAALLVVLLPFSHDVALSQIAPATSPPAPEADPAASVAPPPLLDGPADAPCAAPDQHVRP